MKIPLTIEKSNAEDCPYSCPFLEDAGLNYKCGLFNQDIRNAGYYDSIDRIACPPCRRLYENFVGRDTT